MKTNTCRDGTLKNQPNEIGMTPQHFYTIPTSCAILGTIRCIVNCVHRFVLHVEGCGVSNAGCVVHIVHGECVMLWVAATSFLLSIQWNVPEALTWEHLRVTE